MRDAAKMIVEKFGGRVPATLEELITLPGVGRKTANLVMILAFKSHDNICVDIHVHRIANRLGWVRTRTPEETEQALYKTIDATMVAGDQSVSRDVGTERVPAGVSSLWGLRARDDVPAGWRHASRQRKSVMKRACCHRPLAIAGSAASPRFAQAPAKTVARRRTVHRRRRNREGHVRVRDLSQRSAEDGGAHHRADQQALLQRPARASRGAGLRDAVRRSADARHDEGKNVGPHRGAGRSAWRSSRSCART